MVYETAEIILMGITIISVIVSQIFFWINYIQEKMGKIPCGEFSPFFIVSGISMVIFVITSLLHDQILSISNKIITGITSVIPARPLFYVIYMAIAVVLAFSAAYGVFRLPLKHTHDTAQGCAAYLLFCAIIVFMLFTAENVEQFFVPEEPFDIHAMLNGGH